MKELEDRKLDELTITLFRVWGSDFGIPNWYTGFKIALDRALARFINFLRNIFNQKLYPSLTFMHAQMTYFET